MNRIVTFIALLFSSTIIFANPVDSQKAEQVAKTFIVSKSAVSTANGQQLQMQKALTLMRVSASTTESTDQFYVFNRENNQGFVIVSADDRARPVLAYANSGSYNPNNIPPNMRKWLEGYREQIRFAIENNIPSAPEIQEEWDIFLNGKPHNVPQNTKAVAPLIKTKWNQGQYYNEFCPPYYPNTQKTPTGCVATAMAQVMKYWNYPTVGTGFHSYNHNTYGTLSANFGATTYQWDLMPDVVSSPNYAVATLMYHCGVAVDMNYGVSQSGACTVSSDPNKHCAEYALKAYFGYDKNTLRGVEKSKYTNAEWENLLISELNAGRPVIYRGSGTGGHSFVCDGYVNNNGYNFFYFNWGWGGQCDDSCFALNAINPGSYSFNDNQMAIVGIKPANNTTDNFDLRLYSDLNMSNTIRFWNEIYIAVDVINYGTDNFIGQIGAAVFDKQGNFIDFVEVKSDFPLIPQHYHTLIFRKLGGAPFIPGNYIVAVFYKTSTRDWTIIDGGNYYNNKGFIINYSADIETNSAFTVTNNGGKLIQGNSTTVNVDVINTGSNTFYGRLRVNLANLNGTWAQDIQILSETNGLSYNCHYINGNNFTGVITVEPGTYLMEIAYQPEGSSSWYYAGSSNYYNPVFVIVEGPPILPDIYENNNTQEQSCNLPFGFSGNSAMINTSGSNFHVGDNLDYYKIVLPDGYDYKITARLHDAYNSGNGLTYTADAMFAYSTNGINYSETYDNIMPGYISVSNGGTVYFRVAPYFEGSMGTYLLTLNITRNPITAINGITTENNILLYPNPSSDIVKIEYKEHIIKNVSIVDLMGKVVIETEKTEIDISYLPSSTYIVRIYSDRGVITKRLIVKR